MGGRGRLGGGPPCLYPPPPLLRPAPSLGALSRTLLMTSVASDMRDDAWWQSRQLAKQTTGLSSGLEIYLYVCFEGGPNNNLVGQIQTRWVPPGPQGHLQAALPCLNDHGVIVVMQCVRGEADSHPNMHPGGHQTLLWGLVELQFGEGEVRTERRQQPEALPEQCGIM